MAAPLPYEPTEAEVADHNLTHLPYRNWCRICVAANGKERPHRTRRGYHDAGLPKAGVDYAFLTDHMELVEEQEGEGILPIVVMKVSPTGMTFAHSVSKKGGADTFAAKALADDIDSMGLKTVTVQSDQEPAVTALVARLRAHRAEETIPELSPVGDPASNGLAEKGVQEVVGQARARKLGLEDRMKCSIPLTHRIIPWLVEAAAFDLRSFCIGHDGRTPYERLKGKKMRTPIAEFGETVLYKVPDRGGDHQLGKVEARWGSGIWLGLRARSMEHLIGTEGGIRTARTIQRRPLSDRCRSKGHPGAGMGKMTTRSMLRPILLRIEVSPEML